MGEAARLRGKRRRSGKNDSGVIFLKGQYQ